MNAATTLEEFLNALASAAPTPGGGSAAASIGAMGAGLVSMVCHVTLAKKGFATVAPEMRAVAAESERLRAALTAMIAADMTAFGGLMDAYRLAKRTAAETTARDAAIQANLLGATRLPLECARACAQVIGISRRAALHGYAAVISDAGVGVLAANAALRSAALNVRINAPLIEDRAFAAAAVKTVDELLEFGNRESESVFELVRARLS